MMAEIRSGIPLSRSLGGIGCLAMWQWTSLFVNDSHETRPASRPVRRGLGEGVI
jgi:hypothetical protein